MKKTIAIAAVIGVNAGIFWVSVVGAVLNLYTPLTPLWTAAMWASCPPILAIRKAWVACTCSQRHSLRWNCSFNPILSPVHYPVREGTTGYKARGAGNRIRLSDC
jgi:hypothetical protein